MNKLVANWLIMMAIMIMIIIITVPNNRINAAWVSLWEERETLHNLSDKDIRNILTGELYLPLHGEDLVEWRFDSNIQYRKNYLKNTIDFTIYPLCSVGYTNKLIITHNFNVEEAQWMVYKVYQPEEIIPFHVVHITVAQPTWYLEELSSPPDILITEAKEDFKNYCPKPIWGSIPIN